MLKRAITVCTQFEGIHCWPEAPEEVKFLRNPHRHIFQIRANVKVGHNDRDVEFIMLKRRIDSWLMDEAMSETFGTNTNEYGLVWEMGRMSCEQVAEETIEVIQQFVGDQRTITVFVSEDGENEAMVQYVSDWEDCSDLLEDDDDFEPIPVPKQSRTLSLEGYQRQSYVAIQEHENNKEEVMHWAIGLGEETGETLSVIKHKYYGGDYDVEDLIKELGDTLWNIAALCSACNLNLEGVAEYNLARLRHRYPNGVFDDSRSIERHNVDKSFKDTEEHTKIMSKIFKDSTNWKQGV